jgi:dTDP-4-dehydrorhamnose reductase
VNGEATPADRPFRSGDAPAPQDEYGRSKWRAEQALARMSGLEVVVIRRLSSMAGVKANFLRLLQLVDTGLPLPFASIDNRPQLHLRRNLAALIRRCAGHAARGRRDALAADGDPVSTPELVRRIAAALGRKARLVPFPPALLPRRLSGSLAIESARSARAARVAAAVPAWRKASPRTAARFRA